MIAYLYDNWDRLHPTQLDGWRDKNEEAKTYNSLSTEVLFLGSG